MEGVTPVGSEGNKAGESPPSDTSGRTGAEEERKVREAGQMRPGGQVVVFPSNSHWVITYPTSEDLALDTQNKDTFVKFELIRLPTELGGDAKDATAFVAFSKVCVHLWCSPNYNPDQPTNPNENGYKPNQSK